MVGPKAMQVHVGVVQRVMDQIVANLKWVNIDASLFLLA